MPMPTSPIPTDPLTTIPGVEPHRLVDDLLPADVSFLMRLWAWPSVSITLPTTPADRMTGQDTDVLHALVDRAEAELQALAVLTTSVRTPLRAVVDDARHGPTRAGLALFVSQAVQRGYRLPVAASPRAVAEPTFATRDLVHNLQRTPSQLLLVVTLTSAQLYRGFADTLIPFEEHGFPVQQHLDPAGAAGGSRWEHPSGFVRRVDQALAAARAEIPAQILVAGATEPVSALLRTSRNLHRLAGVLPHEATQPAEDLVEAARVSLEEYLASREQEAPLLLESARVQAPSSVRAGLEAAREGAHPAAHPRMLLIEEGFGRPAAVEGHRLRRIDALHVRVPVAGDVRHDVVDDLIEVVINRGGWVAFTRDGTLRSEHRVALVAD